MADDQSLLRPTFIDIESRTASAASFRGVRAMLSPRIQHFAGDVPPSLSPLDAIAAQSRRLAKELEETRNAGQRRMSRLPPHVVTESLTQHKAERPHCFRSLSDYADGDSTPTEKPSSGNSPEMTEPKVRPTSEQPRYSGVLDLSVDTKDDFRTPREYPAELPVHPPPVQPTDYFDVPRAQSPEPVETLSPARGPPVPEDAYKDQSLPRQESGASQPDLTLTPAPPNAAFARKGTNKSHTDSSDEDYASSNAGSTFSQQRKLSSNSGTSVPHSPLASYLPGHARSGSGNSVSSTLSHGQSKSHLNFSRPMTPTSHPTMESPPTQRSIASYTSHPSYAAVETPHTPTSFDETKSEASDGHVSAPATSYTYGKFTLPRGRHQVRESIIFDGLSTPNFEWQEPLFPSTPPLRAMNDQALGTPPPPAPGRLAKSFEDHARSAKLGFSFESMRKGSMTQDKPFFPLSPSSPSKSPRNKLQKRPVTSPTPQPRVLEVPPQLEHPAPVSPKIELMPVVAPESLSLSSRSNSTLRPQTSRSHSHYQDFSADDHVTQAIELHQHGDLKESTYHLRKAAQQNHAHGMLLYALACRHGWGVRANPEEGVEWLRKAVDSAILEVADDETTTPETPRGDMKDKQAHRAQFALAIYELGVSHLNGWGIEQDKALALRCFEIAGNWGDVDALSEAGFCYAEGIGCKKDLKKAAKWYRRAEARGVSMVGNSWIHKEKYDEKDDIPKSAGKEETVKRRSRSKSIWQRRKVDKSDKAEKA